MRELLLKSFELEEVNVAVVNEIKGNPSRITFYSNKGEIYLTILITASLSNNRLHILPKNLKIVSEIQELNILSKIFNYELVDKADENFILISKTDNEDFLGKISFINKFGDETDFQINIKMFNLNDYD